nr:immunoglobulin light chain junction region [Macaca mulatta]MOV79969.1 immunoglobulin light chain junction region [Macaca mulatta]
CGQAIAFPLTF